MIDLDGRRAVVHADPRPEGYGAIEVLGRDGELAAPELGLPSISLAELFSVS